MNSCLRANELRYNISFTNKQNPPWAVCTSVDDKKNENPLFTTALPVLAFFLVEFAEKLARDRINTQLVSSAGPSLFSLSDSAP